MSFSEEVVKQAWNRANRHCENCNKLLNWYERGSESKQGWEAHHIKALKNGGDDSLSNCKILCQECHKRTHSYGNSD